jgi:hypothetical protein
VPSGNSLGSWAGALRDMRQKQTFNLSLLMHKCTSRTTTTRLASNSAVTAWNEDAGCINLCPAASVWVDAT